MRLFHNMSFRGKQMLVIMLTSTAALLLACGAFVAYNVVSFKKELTAKVSLLTEVIGKNCAAAIDFNDPKNAEDTLSALRVEPGIVSACVYDRQGKVFAVYKRESAAVFVPPPAQPAGHDFSGNQLRMFRSIQLRGERIGTVFLASDLTQLRQRLASYPSIVGMMFTASLVVAFTLSMRLQRVVSGPILHLAHVAQRVALDKDYSMRAIKETGDELGQLIDCFNEMLAQIQERDANLEHRVKDRTEELARSLSLLNATLESTADGILAVDLSGNAVCHNQKFAAIWGLAGDLVEKASSAELVSHAAAQMSDPEPFLELFRKSQAHPEVEAFGVLPLKDGRTFECYIRPQQIRDQCIGRVLICRDITERKRADAKLEEAHREVVSVSRQAGMAEVATTVLHNVGNVLNSVNVSASLVADQLKASKTSNLARVAALMRERAADLGDFMSRDPRGKALPVYLGELAERLSAEHSALSTEVESLKKNIEHIKEIVAMQQRYAKVGGVTEMVKTTDLVEDALRMNAGALVRHEVEVVREYDPLIPEITVEKHKVMQILINLIRNAKYACDDADHGQKRITIRVSNGGDRVRISVSDNGVGIPQENLTRIFNYGFTTRKGGHGFGLHSGALSAKELGGVLLAHSEGPGKGATFTLELPKQPKAQIS